MGKKRGQSREGTRKAGKTQQARDDRVFKALANADRRAILDLLRESPKTTGDLCEAIRRLDRCTVMLHLKALEAADLIIVRRNGRHRWNYLNIEPVQRIYNRWIKDYAQPAAEFLIRLKDELEE